ncbi:hypothetical protein [Chitinibacter tainanensis]|uniref:hypothetical protein n=1 Tax=Chitinibacter tainanensis TaxID=230667 RepID=UPI0023550656|nr:hypothetical protein [Chitinibacter tainanensis]
METLGMNCTGCGAALAIDALVCPYCGLHNAVDLLAIRDFKVLAEHSELRCPAGCGDLRLLQLGAGLHTTVGHCPSCNGLHFAPGALQIALDKVAGQVREINHGRLARIKAERIPSDSVRYRPCPVCQKLMHRRAFSPQVRIIVDDCHAHGQWLDSGEFTVLAEWHEAGGQQLAAQEAERQQRIASVQGDLPPPPPTEPTPVGQRPLPDWLSALLIAGVIAWLFGLIWPVWLLLAGAAGSWWWQRRS